MIRFLFLPLFALTLGAQAPAPEHLEFFEKTIRPILTARCQGCHNSKISTAGIDLSAGPGSGIPAGRLLQAVEYEGRVKMPPAGKLPDMEIAALAEWTRRGAPWPAARSKSTASSDHWAFRPLQNPAPPKVRNEAWIQSPVDRFLLSRMENRQLAPAPPTSKEILIRRAAFDLTGLPPSEADVQSFLADHSPNAFAKVVDRLLASPRYGEKWGRHWLDVARYADSTGADEDYRYPHAWRYRDYVIDAFNRDIPVAQFIREQIAGDLLPPPPGEEVNTAGIIATGFLALGPKLVAEQDKLKMFYDIVDEQIDVTGKAFLGLTISCARCHDHKFDPITIKDYYSLASIFASTRQLEQIEGTVSKLFYAPLVGKAKAAEYGDYQKRVADKQKEIDAITAAQARSFRDRHAPRIAAYMLAARNGNPAAGLDPAVLARWVAYLKPAKERRPHLEPWLHATPAQLETVAAEYQSDYLNEIARRQKAQDDWKLASESARASGAAPPAAPRFLAGDNRFFTEISAAKGPLGLPEKDPESVYTEAAKTEIALRRTELKAIKDTAPPEPPFACGVAEDKSVDQHVFLRGNPEAHGPLVPKRFPVVLAGENQPAVQAGSGRLELAEWLASPGNPLPARVMVNRIWQGHFGQGIVRTANNFGLAGERPTHPELLDWLASEFLAHGGSVKHLHRVILLSSAYQMSGNASELHREKDPENQLFTRFIMRRKTVEEIRDSLLLLDGSLDQTMGGALATGTGTDNEFSDSRKSMHPDDSKRRTVYLPLRRSNLATLFNLYDFGDATTSTEIRAETNVAPQALFMMNSKFVAERSRSLAERLLASEPAAASRVRRAWITILGREPAPAEAASSLQYIGGFPTGGDALLPWASLCRALIASNDFIYLQ